MKISEMLESTGAVPVHAHFSFDVKNAQQDKREMHSPLQRPLQLQDQIKQQGLSNNSL